MSYADDKFREHLKTVLAAKAPLPAKVQTLGPVTATWFESEPSIAVIQTTGGTTFERTMAEWMTRETLRLHGYRQAQFSIDPGYEWDPSGSHSLRESSTKLGAWADIMQKAKRLIQSGQVSVLRNGWHNVVGHVIGDHGEYITEISREDPNSRTLTQWQCECPWSQYAWQRTRQWKKYEGRPCAHVMALYWKSLATPLDDVPPGMTPSPGQRTKPLAPGEQQTPPPAAPEDLPRTFLPDGSTLPPDGTQAPLTGMPATPQGAPPGPMPASPDIIPPFPGAAMEAMEAWQPGMTPSGGVSPPNAMSIPGAKIQTPFNPIQHPGGTYSRVAAAFQNGQRVTLLEDEYGVKEGREGAYDAGQYTLVPKGSPGEVMGQDATTGWVECLFPLDGGKMSSYHVRVFLEPRQIRAIQGGTPFIKRRSMNLS